MNKKIIIGIIVAAAVIIGIISLVSDVTPSSPNSGLNGTTVVPPPPRHYSITLNETAGVSAHS